MKITILILTALVVLILSSCLNNYSSDKMISPSGKYYIIANVNRTDKSKDDYAYVMLLLYSVDGQLISELNTRAGDSNKWAIGWEAEMDTVIMNSSDIGIYAWSIDDSEMRELGKNEITESIKKTSRRNKKK